MPHSPTKSDLSFGLPPGTLDKIKTCLAQYPEIRWVKIFGSRAKGNYRPSSDVDLAISSPVDLSSKIAAALEELSTPYQFDVVHYESIELKALKENIDRDGKIVTVSP